MNLGAQGSPFLPYDLSIRGGGCWYPYDLALHASPPALSKKEAILNGLLFILETCTEHPQAEGNRWGHDPVRFTNKCRTYLNIQLKHTEITAIL